MTTNPKKEPVPNPENADALYAAKKIENTNRQNNPANAQDKNANLSQDFEAQIKRGVKPIGIDELSEEKSST